MATLSVVDAADGTGATATISGSSGGSNTVYTQSVDGVIGAGSWSLGGTRTGDGAVTLSLAKGYYFAYCLTGSTLSGLSYFGVTDGLDPVPDRCFAAVKSRLQLLNLDCTVRVYDYTFAADPAVKHPCTLLTTEGTRQTDEAALNGRDDWGHEIRVLIRDSGVAFDEAMKARFRLWRQAITRAFQNQRLPGVIESVRCKVSPGPLLRQVPDLKRVAESELTVRCICREVRGLGA